MHLSCKASQNYKVHLNLYHKRFIASLTEDFVASFCKYVTSLSERFVVSLSQMCFVGKLFLKKKIVTDLFQLGVVGKSFHPLISWGLTSFRRDL